MADPGGHGHLPGEITDEQVAQFQELAECPPAQARFLLEAAGGDVAAALQLMFDQFPAPSGHQAPVQAPQQPQQQQQQRAYTLPPRPPAPATVAGAQPQRAPPVQAPRTGLIPGLIGAAIRLPFFLIRTSLGVVSASIALGLGVAGFVGDKVLPAPVMRSIRGVAAAVTGSDELDALAQAHRFIHQFKSAYGDRHPRFVPTELQQACVTARTEHRFLFVYLHSPEHEDTDHFCREVMCDPDLVTYANAQFMCWGGDVRMSDAHGLSMRLGATTYPFVAVLSMAHNNKATLIKAAQGTSLLAPGMLLHLLQWCVEEQGAVLVAQRAEVMERESTRRLLQEQNQEYEASLAADIEREQRLQEERRERERQEREEREKQERERLARETHERRRQERVQAIQTRRTTKQASLPPEAESGQGNGTAVVRVRLPNGSNAQRCFPAGSTVGHVFDFVDSLESTNYWQYSLVSNYPRKVFTQGGDEAKTSLADAGLAPHAALFVQPMDQEEEDVPVA